MQNYGLSCLSMKLWYDLRKDNLFTQALLNISIFLILSWDSKQIITEILIEEQ